jgi:hypothetical protein
VEKERSGVEEAEEGGAGAERYGRRSRNNEIKGRGGGKGVGQGRAGGKETE